MNQITQKSPPNPTAVGPGGKNKKMQKSPAEIPPYLRGTEGARRGKFIGTQLSPPGPTANAVRTRGA